LIVKTCGFALVAPNPRMMVTSNNADEAEDQPARTKKIDARATHSAARIPAAAAVRCDW
jgi:hypothetical protein